MAHFFTLPGLYLVITYPKYLEAGIVGHVFEAVTKSFNQSFLLEQFHEQVHEPRQ
jgi:hypothetical protein